VLLSLYVSVCGGRQHRTAWSRVDSRDYRVQSTELLVFGRMGGVELPVFACDGRPVEAVVAGLSHEGYQMDSLGASDPSQQPFEESRITQTDA
jgi:hypothetical protein